MAAYEGLTVGPQVAIGLGAWLMLLSCQLARKMGDSTGVLRRGEVLAAKGGSCGGLVVGECSVAVVVVAFGG